MINPVCVHWIVPESQSFLFTWAQINAICEWRRNRGRQKQNQQRGNEATITTVTITKCLIPGCVNDFLFSLYYFLLMCVGAHPYAIGSRSFVRPLALVRSLSLCHLCLTHFVAFIRSMVCDDVCNRITFMCLVRKTVREIHTFVYGYCGICLSTSMWLTCKKWICQPNECVRWTTAWNKKRNENKLQPVS